MTRGTIVVPKTATTLITAVVVEHSAELAEGAGTAIFKSIIAAAFARILNERDKLSPNIGADLKAAWKAEEAGGKRMMYNWLASSERLASRLVAVQYKAGLDAALTCTGSPTKSAEVAAVESLCEFVAKVLADDGRNPSFRGLRHWLNPEEDEEAPVVTRSARTARVPGPLFDRVMKLLDSEPVSDDDAIEIAFEALRRAGGDQMELAQTVLAMIEREINPDFAIGTVKAA